MRILVYQDTMTKVAGGHVIENIMEIQQKPYTMILKKHQWINLGQPTNAECMLILIFGTISIRLIRHMYTYNTNTVILGAFLI